MIIHACTSCDSEWLPGIAVLVHDDDCPDLAASRAHEPGCRRDATGFCHCPGAVPVPLDVPGTAEGLGDAG